MASYIALNVSVVDNTDNKHIVVYGGGIGSGFNFKDIYDAVGLLKPEWVDKIGNLIIFKVPVIIGDENGNYFTVIDESSYDCRVDRIYTSLLSYDEYIKFINIEGSIVDHCNIITSGDINFDTVITDTLILTLTNINFTCTNLRFNDTASGDWTINCTYSNFNGNVFANNSNLNLEFPNIEAQLTIDAISNISDPIFKNDTLLKINESVDIDSPEFINLDIIFTSDSKTLNLYNIKNIEAFNQVANSPANSSNKIYSLTQNRTVTVINNDSTPIENVLIKIYNKDDELLINDYTDAAGELDISGIVIAEFDLVNLGEIVSEWISDAPLKVELIYNSLTFYGILSDTINDTTFKINSGIVNYNKLVGYNVDASNLIRNNRLYEIRNNIWKIRIKIYDETGQPIDLASLDVKIAFYNSNYDSEYFKQYSATTKNENGEAYFQIASIETANFVNMFYNYKITVGGEIIINDDLEVSF